MAKGRLEATVRVVDMPDVLADLCARMAGLLRARAGEQDDTVVGWAVRDALLETAAAFEVGMGVAEVHRTDG